MLIGSQNLLDGVQYSFVSNPAGYFLQENIVADIIKIFSEIYFEYIPNFAVSCIMPPQMLLESPHGEADTFSF